MKIKNPRTKKAQKRLVRQYNFGAGRLDCDPYDNDPLGRPIRGAQKTAKTGRTKSTCRARRQVGAAAGENRPTRSRE